MQKQISEQDLIRILEDSGCDKALIERFMTSLEAERKEVLTELLINRRTQLLHRVHKEEKQIDCLDYLVYQIEKGRVSAGNIVRKQEGCEKLS